MKRTDIIDDNATSNKEGLMEYLDQNNIDDYDRYHKIKNFITKNKISTQDLNLIISKIKITVTDFFKIDIFKHYIQKEKIDLAQAIPSIKENGLVFSPTLYQVFQDLKIKITDIEYIYNELFIKNPDLFIKNINFFISNKQENWNDIQDLKKIDLSFIKNDNVIFEILDCIAENNNMDSSAICEMIKKNPCIPTKYNFMNDIFKDDNISNVIDDEDIIADLLECKTRYNLDDNQLALYCLLSDDKKDICSHIKSEYKKPSSIAYPNYDPVFKSEIDNSQVFTKFFKIIDLLKKKTALEGLKTKKYIVPLKGRQNSLFCSGTINTMRTNPNDINYDIIIKLLSVLSDTDYSILHTSILSQDQIKIVDLFKKNMDKIAFILSTEDGIEKINSMLFGAQDGCVLNLETQFERIFNSAIFDNNQEYATMYQKAIEIIDKINDGNADVANLYHSCNKVDKYSLANKPFFDIIAKGNDGNGLSANIISSIIPLDIDNPEYIDYITEGLNSSELATAMIFKKFNIDIDKKYDKFIDIIEKSKPIKRDNSQYSRF